MRFLADENLPRPVVQRLRREGLDVRWVQEDFPGVRDEEVLEAAAQDGRVLLTFDKDFGELAFRWGLPADSGVILLRFNPFGFEATARKLLSVLGSRTSWAGVFAVVEEARIRIVPLPPVPEGRD